MDDPRDIVATWIAEEIFPHERDIRNYLNRRWQNLDADEVIQEAYCRIAALGSVDHIDNPGGYFHCTVMATATDIARRSKSFYFISMNENEWSNVVDDEPLADRIVAADQELERVNGLLARLTDTCRRAIELRRIEGLSQRETAEQLGVSEAVVRNHLFRGVRKIMQGLADEEAPNDERESLEQKVVFIGKSRSR
jgi:RNA polymerase sigma factor (sigma-70 family)